MVGTRNGRDAFLFLLPAGLLYFGFLHGPIFGAILISFADYDIISPIRFIGFENYIRLFTSERTLGIYRTTFRIAIPLVVLHGTIGLGLALLVKSVHERWQGFFRIMFYLPVVITTASMAIAWSFLFNYHFGAVNWMLARLGMAPVPWTISSEHVFRTIYIFSIWKFVGTSFMYYYIGLNGIPEQYYEAAVVDGAGPLARFRYVTLPMLTPTIFFVVTILCIRTVQMFDEPYFLTGGGPGDASRTLNLHIYETAFRSYDMGFASAVSVTLLLILIVFTIFQNVMSRKWVNYDR